MSAEIIDLRPGRQDFLATLSPEHRTFCLARQQMMQALQSWLRAGGKLEDIEQEIGPVTSVMRQLIELEHPDHA